MKNIRWYLFWINDYIHGKKVYKAYKDIKNTYYNYNKEETEVKLQKLLKHTTTNSKFYQEYKNKDISDYPIMDKRKIIENIENIKVKDYKEDELHTMSTSGSTGTIFSIKQNKEKRNRVIAEVIFFGKIANFTFGQRQMNLRVWTEKNRKSTLQRKLQNMITQDISNLDERSLQEISEKLKNDKSIKNILSYASTLDVISDYMLKNNYNKYTFSLNSIISGAEALQEPTRKKLEEIFKCYVISRYSNQENGILAQEDIHNKKFYLNRANYYFEFLKLDEDIPAEKGELARIVITDLYNYAEPIIRYDTGDVAIIDEGEKELALKEIYGRRVDIIYDTKGEAVSPHSITINMWGIKEVKQFKFIQEGKKDYILELNANEKLKEETNIIDKYKQILGEDANIKIQYVKEIPIIASGKRKYVENRYN